MPASRNPARRLKSGLLLTCLLSACSPTRGCIESEFTLDPNSRLPAWVDLPAGSDRRELKIELYYWTSGLTVYVSDLGGRQIASMNGKSCWHPATHWPIGGPVAPDPHYVILVVNDVVDVAEHSNGSWSMSDDSKILASAKAPIERGECRRSPDEY